MTRACYELSAEELEAMLNLGYELLSGPYISLAQCQAACTEADTGTGTGTNVGTGTGTVEPDPGPPVNTPCCEVDLSSVLFGFFTDKGGFAAAFPDVVEFIWDTPLGGWVWHADESICGGPANLSIICTGSTAANLHLFSGASTLGPSGQAPDVSPAPSCDPLDLIYTVSGTFGCGTGTYKLQVTE